MEELFEDSYRPQGLKTANRPQKLSKMHVFEDGSILIGEISLSLLNLCNEDLQTKF